MQNPTVSRCCKLILSACVLASLAGCGTAPPITKTSSVEIPQAVVKKIDPALLKDCEPHYLYPSTSMTIEAITDRTAAVEDALAICRNNLELIRAAQ